MSFLSALKPDPDKWALSLLLFIMYWVIYVTANWVTDYLYAQTYPILNQPLPQLISLPEDWAPIFEEYWREVERSKMPFIALKLIISSIGCYLTACLLMHLIRTTDADS